MVVCIAEMNTLAVHGNSQDCLVEVCIVLGGEMAY